MPYARTFSFVAAKTTMHPKFPCFWELNTESHHWGLAKGIVGLHSIMIGWFPLLEPQPYGPDPKSSTATLLKTQSG
jgi:hypothetical protein